MDAPRLVALLGVGIAATLVAAKAHGRQVRLEREREGYHEVVFGGSNPPFVEALWRRDRVRFWAAFPLLLAFAAALLWLAWGMGAHLLAALAWAAVGAFALAGLRHPVAWEGDARRGTTAWWLLVALSSLALLALSTPWP